MGGGEEKTILNTLILINPEIIRKYALKKKNITHDHYFYQYIVIPGIFTCMIAKHL